MANEKAPALHSATELWRSANNLSMSKTKSKLITYHVEYYPSTANADASKFETFLATQTTKDKEANYISFTSSESRLNIWRSCDLALKKEFYYALVFELDDGVHAITYPASAQPGLPSQPDAENGDLNSILDALGEIVRAKAAVKRKNK